MSERIHCDLCDKSWDAYTGELRTVSGERIDGYLTLDGDPPRHFCDWTCLRAYAFAAEKAQRPSLWKRETKP